MTVLLKQKNYVRSKDRNTNFKILFHNKCFASRVIKSSLSDYFCEGGSLYVYGVENVVEPRFWLEFGYKSLKVGIASCIRV